MFSFFCLWRVPSSADVGAKTGTYVITCAKRMVPEGQGNSVWWSEPHASAILNWVILEASFFTFLYISLLMCKMGSIIFWLLWQLHEMMHIRGLASSLAPGNCLANHVIIILTLAIPKMKFTVESCTVARVKSSFNKCLLFIMNLVLEEYS